MSESVICISNLSKIYKLYNNPMDRLKESLHPLRKKYHRDFYALANVSFEVKKGETIGIIGNNGSGKSTLLKILAGVLTPSSGSIKVNSNISALLELGAGFNPELTGIENIYFNGAILGYSREAMETKIEGILSFADIGDFIHQQVKTYSSGMAVRLAFAVQAMTNPEILVIDEALAVGDAEFQTRCFARMNRLKASGTTILFVSHDMASVRSFCDRAVYLGAGKLVGIGDVTEVVDQYKRDVLKRSHASAANREGTGAVGAPDHAVLLPSRSDASTVLHALIGEQTRFQERANRDRRGSGRISILSFAILNDHDVPIAIVEPHQTIKACFLLRSDQDISADIHVGLTVKDKFGTPVAVIRDSSFEETLHFLGGQDVVGEMRFSLPLKADAYYIQIGLLLFPPNTKYLGDTFNFTAAEIADLVEYGVHFEVASWRKHPIPITFLVESALTLSHSAVVTK